MASGVSVFWPKHVCSDLVSTFQLSALKNTQRLKVLERSVFFLPLFAVIEKANIMQMARKMDFSVVGLPHYTIWHLYEPSVDDIKHMEVRNTHQTLQENKTNADARD